MMKNLLGLFQQQPDQLQSLLGDYYDPRTAKMKWLGGTLQGLGMGLASGQPGAWATGLAQGGGQALDDYRKEALTNYQFKTAADDRAYGRERDAANDAWRKEQAQAEADRWAKSFAFQQAQAARNAAWADEQRAHEKKGWAQEEALREGQQNAVDAFRNNFVGQGGNLFSPDMQGWLRASGVSGVNPSDTIRYNQAKPYIDAGDSATAFNTIAATTPTTGVAAEVAQRKAAATSMGLSPDDPAYRPYVLTGKMPDAQDNSVADAQNNKKMTVTDTVSTAAAKARGLISNWSTGLVGQVSGNYGPSDAAELQRQVDVLKATAKIENLNAMRRESKTGGALGAVSDSETAMLASAAGALDPSAGPERFKEQLNNYERTLLRIIHGYDAGNSMFYDAHPELAPSSATGGKSDIDAIVNKYLPNN